MLAINPIFMVGGSARIRTLKNGRITSMTVYASIIPNTDPAGTISSHRKWMHICWNWDKGELLAKITIMRHAHILDQWINVLFWKHLVQSKFIVLLIGETYALVS